MVGNLNKLPNILLRQTPQLTNLTLRRDQISHRSLPSLSALALAFFLRCSCSLTAADMSGPALRGPPAAWRFFRASAKAAFFCSSVKTTGYSSTLVSSSAVFFAFFFSFFLRFSACFFSSMIACDYAVTGVEMVGVTSAGAFTLYPARARSNSSSSSLFFSFLLNYLTGAAIKILQLATYL